MKFEDVLLALIARHPASGYDLGQWLATGGIFIRANADQSQIYKALNRLYERGLTDYIVDKREGAPDAKVYSVTPAGHDRLFMLAGSEYRPAPRWQEPDFSVRYGLFGSIRPEYLPTLIQTELTYRHEQIARFRNRQRTPIIADGTPVDERQTANEVFEDLHVFNVATIDLWLEHLQTLLTRWTTRFPASP